MTTWHRVTYPAHLENGGTRKTTIVLQDMVRNRGCFTEQISGREVNRNGDLTDRLHVIITEPGEATIVALVQDLQYGTLVSADQESAASREMRAS